MTGTIGFGHFAIVLGPLIDIFDHQRNWRACRLPLENTRENFDLIRLLPLGRIFGLAGPARIEKRLDVGFAQ